MLFEQNAKGLLNLFWLQRKNSNFQVIEQQNEHIYISTDTIIPEWALQTQILKTA